MIVRNASGPVLDWLVAQALGIKHHIGSFGPLLDFEGVSVYAPTDYRGHRIQPSEKWEQGGPIIETQGISLRREIAEQAPGSMTMAAYNWQAASRDRHTTAFGPTALIAAMRCVVVTKLGDVVEDIPSKLVKKS